MQIDKYIDIDIKYIDEWNVRNEDQYEIRLRHANPALNSEPSKVLEPFLFLCRQLFSLIWCPEARIYPNTSHVTKARTNMNQKGHSLLLVRVSSTNRDYLSANCIPHRPHYNHYKIPCPVSPLSSSALALQLVQPPPDLRKLGKGRGRLSEHFKGSESNMFSKRSKNSIFAAWTVFTCPTIVPKWTNRDWKRPNNFELCLWSFGLLVDDQNECGHYLVYKQLG